MNKKDIATIWDVITKLNYERANPKFTYAISKNKKILLPLMKEIEEAKTRSPEYVAYDAERLELCKNMAEKDDKGEPIIEDGNYKIADSEAFDKEYELLQEKHKEMFEKEEENKVKFEKMLEEEVEIDLYTVKVDYAPEEIPIKFMDILMDVIIVD
jgi:hypothetical protein